MERTGSNTDARSPKNNKSRLVIVSLLALAGLHTSRSFYEKVQFNLRRIDYDSASAPSGDLSLIFSSVLSLDGKPGHATAEWKSMHISMPVIPLGLLFIFVIQVIRIFDKIRLTVADSNRFIICWVAISAILIIITVMRTPESACAEKVCLYGGFFCAFWPIHFLTA